MPRYFFDINGKNDGLGVLFDTEIAAIEDALKTVIWLSKHDQPSAEFGNEWTCKVRDEHHNHVESVTRYYSLDQKNSSSL